MVSSKNGRKIIIHPSRGTPIGSAPGSQPINPGVLGKSISSHMTEAILVTIFCCWPFGIPAIVFAGITNSYLRRGMIPEALDASRKAGAWTLVSLILGLVVGVIYIFVIKGV